MPNLRQLIPSLDYFLSPFMDSGPDILSFGLLMFGVRILSHSVDLVAVSYLERFMGEQEIESASKARTLIKDSFLWHMFF